MTVCLFTTNNFLILLFDRKKRRCHKEQKYLGQKSSSNHKWLFFSSGDALISFRDGDDSCWFLNFFGLVVLPTHFMGLFRFSYLLNYFKFNSSPALIYSFHKFEEQHEGYLNHERECKVFSTWKINQPPEDFSKVHESLTRELCQ